MTKVGSRDLSEIFAGILAVTIEGIGHLKIRATPHGKPIGTLVAEVQCVLMEESVWISNIRETPWEVVSFDRENKHITVKLAS